MAGDQGSSTTGPLAPSLVGGRPGEEEGTTRRQGTRGRSATRVTTGPSAPSLGDQGVDHVIVVGRDTMAGAPRREALRVTTGPLAPSLVGELEGSRRADTT